LFPAAVLIAVAACAWSGLRSAADTPRPGGRECGGLPAFAVFDADGWRYEFHAVTGRERLVRLADVPNGENLADAEPEVTARMRTSLAADLGLESLEELREAHRDAIDRLRALGYL